MTNGGIFYEGYLSSLTISCSQNYLGVRNTVCEIVFGTQNALRADSNITVVFSGMGVATDLCEVRLASGEQLDSTCRSTEDNLNVTIELQDTQNLGQYPRSNFTLTVYGVSI